MGAPNYGRPPATGGDLTLNPTVIDYAYDGYGRRKRLGVAAVGEGMPEVTYWYDGATQRLAEIRSAQT